MVIATTVFQKTIIIVITVVDTETVEDGSKLLMLAFTIVDAFSISS